MVRLRLMKSRGEEHKGDEESDGDSQEESFVLMETTGSPLKFHHALLHGRERQRQRTREIREQIEENIVELGDSAETLVLLFVLLRSVHLKVGLWSLSSPRIRFSHSSFLYFVLCCSVP